MRSTPVRCGRRARESSARVKLTDPRLWIGLGQYLGVGTQILVAAKCYPARLLTFEQAAELLPRFVAYFEDDTNEYSGCGRRWRFLEDLRAVANEAPR